MEENEIEYKYNQSALDYLKKFYYSNRAEIEDKYNQSEPYRSKVISSVQENGLSEENWRLIAQKDFGYIGQGLTRKPASFETINKLFIEAINEIKSLDSYDDIFALVQQKYHQFGNLAWFVKYLAIFYSNKFMPFYANNWGCYYLDRLEFEYDIDEGFRYSINKYYKKISLETDIPFEHLNFTLVEAFDSYDISFYIDKAFLDINRPCDLFHIMEYVNAPYSKSISQNDISRYVWDHCPNSTSYNGTNKYEKFLEDASKDNSVADIRSLYILNENYKNKILKDYYPWEKDNPINIPLMRGEHDLSGSKRKNTKKDLLSRKVYAYALAEMIINKSTKAPLNIGVCAKWGEGKTHLMNLIKDHFNHQNKLISENFLVNFLNNLGIFPNVHKVKIVNFDAWEYEDQKQIWAGLIEAILKEYKGFWSYCRFILWKSLGQLKKLENYFKLIVSMGLFGLFYKFSVWFLPNFEDYKTLAVSIQEINIWWFSFYASLITLISPSLTKNPFINLDSKFLKYLEMPTYEANLGFREEIKELIQFAVKAMTNNGQKRLVLFIDNLDRCSLENIVKVLDSICLFLDCCNGEDNKALNIVSILAIDFRIVKKAVEQKLEGNQAKKLNDENIKLQIEEYLDKIISFPFFIPKEKNISPLLLAHLGLEADYKPSEPSELKELKDPISIEKTASLQEEEGEKIKSSSLDKPKDKKTHRTKQDDYLSNMERLKELSTDEKFYIQEIITYLHGIKNFTPRMINKFANLYFLFKYVFSNKYDQKYMYQPKAFAWWFGLALVWPENIEPDNFDIIRNLIYAIKNADEAETPMAKYYNHFREKYELDSLFDSDAGDFMQKLNLESAIFLNKISTS